MSLQPVHRVLALVDAVIVGVEVNKCGSSIVGALQDQITVDEERLAQEIVQEQLNCVDREREA